MNCSIVIQTCDRYEPFWSGLFHFMNKHWDFSINCPIYFCNEEKDLSLEKRYLQIKTGKGTFVQNLQSILEQVPTDNVFYMLEDFWPQSSIKKDLFQSLYDVFIEQNLDALQISSYTPYYEVEVNQTQVEGQKLLRFKESSPWIYNFQARFWNKKSFLHGLKEPLVSERSVSSAITVEMASDEFARKNMQLKVFLYHYFWYPLSGTAYRGDLTDVGKQMENTMLIDNFVEHKFKLQHAY